MSPGWSRTGDWHGLSPMPPSARSDASSLTRSNGTAALSWSSTACSPAARPARSAVRAKFTLSERTYVCGVCGSVADRDVNAALNLAQYGRNELKVAASGAETRNGRGADQKTGLARQVAVKRKPGTATAGQTRTVPSQRGTASEAAHS